MEICQPDNGSVCDTTEHVERLSRITSAIGTNGLP
jgi:hypothetical protein